MLNLSRRKFLSHSASVAASVSIGTYSLISDQVLGANEKVNFALIGCGGRGPYVARGFIEQGANLLWLCDLHEGRMDKTEHFLEDVLQHKPKRTKDMRYVFDDKNVDAVIIATPDHWHALATIQACQAGKDVYVEKPHAHNIWESAMMKKAAHKYNRIVQVGTQNRSAPYNMAALAYVKSGKLGKIGLVKVYNLKSGGPFKLGEPGKQPPGFDWDKWLGPAPSRPYHQTIFKHGWLKFWDFCGGDLADDGIHQLDLAMMIMGDPGLPSSVSCSGGRIVYKGDDAEVPDVQVATFDFKDFIMTMEMTNYPRYMQKTTATIRRNDVFPYWTQNATRIELYGSELMMTIGRHGGGWQVTTSGGKVVDQMYGRVPDFFHDRNFLDCVKSREKPNAFIDIIHPACSMVYMAAIALRVGNQSLRYDAEKEQFIDHPEANALTKRKYREKFSINEI